MRAAEALMKSILSAVPAPKENPQSGKDLERALSIECSSLSVAISPCPILPSFTRSCGVRASASEWLKITGPNLLAPLNQRSALEIKQFGPLFSA
jgi:hypothetical protein